MAVVSSTGQTVSSGNRHTAHVQADTQVVLEQLNVWCQCMHGAGGIVAGWVTTPVTLVSCGPLGRLFLLGPRDS